MNMRAADPVVEKFDPATLRNVLGQFATGVTVITTLGDEAAPVGLAANSFASVSLEPPLILWSLALTAPSLGAFRTHPSFAINILCEQSKDLAMNFSRSSDTKFTDIAWRPGLDGVPVLDAAAAVMECTVEQRIPAGDHEIYIGHVCRLASADKSPLLFHRGQFSQIGTSI